MHLEECNSENSDTTSLYTYIYIQYAESAPYYKFLIC